MFQKFAQSLDRCLKNLRASSAVSAISVLVRCVVCSERLSRKHETVDFLTERELLLFVFPGQLGKYKYYTVHEVKRKFP